jgi:hypothetical protein
VLLGLPGEDVMGYLEAGERGDAIGTFAVSGGLARIPDTAQVEVLFMDGRPLAMFLNPGDGMAERAATLLHTHGTHDVPNELD